MSDPVTNVEIEDVLSSIRKLVAEEVRATPVARRPEKLGRLILTAAQRVKDDSTETTKSSGPVLLTQPIVPGASPNGERSIDEIPGDARLADFGEVEGAFPDIDSFDESEPQSDSSNGDTSENWTVDLAEDDHTSGDASDAQASVHPDEGGQDDSRSELNRLIEEEVSAALGMSDEDETEDEDHDTIREDHEGWAEVEPDTDWHESKEDHSDCEDELKDATDNDQSAQAETAEDLASDDAAAEAAPQMQEDSDRQGDDDTKDGEQPIADATPAPIQTPPKTLEDKVAALGRLVARGDSQDFEEERDRPDADDLAAASEPMTWPEAPYEEAVEEPVAKGSNVLHAQDAWPQPQSYNIPSREEPTPTGAVQTLDDAEQQAVEIDEDTLREMVVDIVRQELQGALGERITRNVRKLVRREIHRMLISQDFE